MNKVAHQTASGCQEWTQFLSTMEKFYENASKLRLGSNFHSYIFILRKVKKYILFLHIRQSDMTSKDDELKVCHNPFNSINPLTLCIQVDTAQPTQGTQM